MLINTEKENLENTGFSLKKYSEIFSVFQNKKGLLVTHFVVSK